MPTCLVGWLICLLAGGRVGALEVVMWKPFVVPLEGKKRSNFQRPRENVRKAQVFFLFSFYLDSYVFSSLDD
jgi:hypothetical protein